jgi:hypothetical protein
MLLSLNEANPNPFREKKTKDLTPPYADLTDGRRSL